MKKFGLFALVILSTIIVYALPRANAEEYNVCGLPTDTFALAGEDGEPGTLSGIVVNETGEPMEGVLVDAWTRHPGNETHTGRDGKFSLGGFEHEQKTIEVRFSKDGFTPRYMFRQPIGLKNVKVVLDKNTYFEGRVTNSQGEPVEGVVIKAIAGPRNGEGVGIGEVPTETKSGSGGVFRLYVQADKYDIQVRSDKGIVRLPNTSISSNETKHLDLKLEKSLIFLARVVDSQTKEPVKGVRLFSWLRPEVNGISDSNGVVRISNMLPGKFEFWVESKEYCRWWSEECLSEWNRYKIDDEKTGWQRNFDFLDFDLKNEAQMVTIIIEKGVRITGKIVDPDGKPVSGATAAPARSGSGNSLTGDTRFSVETDANGQFVMMLPASKEAKYNLVAHDGKYEQWRNWANGVLEPIQTNPGDVIENVIIKLTQPAAVKGKVVDSSGNPVPNNQVRASAFDKLENRYYDPTARTDANGNFEIKFIRPGKQYIQAYPFWLRADEAPEGTSVVVDLKPNQILEGIELTTKETQKGRVK